MIPYSAHEYLLIIPNTFFGQTKIRKFTVCPNLKKDNIKTSFYNFNRNSFLWDVFFFNLKKVIENQKLIFFPEYVRYEINVRIQNYSLQ